MFVFSQRGSRWRRQSRSSSSKVEESLGGGDVPGMDSLQPSSPTLSEISDFENNRHRQIWSTGISDFVGTDFLADEQGRNTTQQAQLKDCMDEIFGPDSSDEEAM